MGTIESSVDKNIVKMEDQLKLWGARIKELVAKADVATQETKIESRKHLDEVKGKLEATQKKMDEAKAAGGEKWDTFKTGVEGSWKELEATFKKLSH